jgi:uncharacterized protein (TIGR02246 family)
MGHGGTFRTPNTEEGRMSRFPERACAVLLTVVLTLPACRPNASTDRAAVDAESDEEAAATAIRRQGERWIEAASSGDIEQMSELYERNAVFLPPGSPPIRGRDAIAELYRQQFDRFEVEVEFDTDDLVVDQRLAYRRGTYRAELVERTSGDTVVTRDKFLEIWREGENGTWRIARDMWNSLEPSGSAQGSVDTSTGGNDG